MERNSSMSASPAAESPQHKDNKNSQYIVYFDGLCEPKNPGGVATYGLVVKRDGETIHQDGGVAYAKPWTNEASNNVAEYSAVIRGLEWLKKNNLEEAPIILRGDSRLIINQLNKTFKVKAKRILELHAKASQLLSEFKQLRLEWVDRSKNKEADTLSRVAYHRFRKSAKVDYPN
jgi:ribonuclease HI